jgi:multidrug efflux pump subunit AcrA (membrane-fusion protein)
VRGVFPNGDTRMLPGQFARIRVPVGQERSAILVPRVAFSSDQLGAYVLVVNDKDTVERRNVQEGPSKGPLRVVEKGLSGDERVIVNGMLRAAPGRRVSPEEAPPENPAGEAPDELKPAY